MSYYNVPKNFIMSHDSNDYGGGVSFAPILYGFIDDKKVMWQYDNGMGHLEAGWKPDFNPYKNNNNKRV